MGSRGQTAAPVAVWSAEEFGCGIPTIDRERQLLFDYLNALARAKDRASVGQALASLVDYTEIHFSHEEAMFERTGYPAKRAHVAAHEAFRKRVHEAAARFRAASSHSSSNGGGGASVPLLDDGLVEYLVDWLGNHIKKMGRGYVHFLAPMMQSRMYALLFNTLRDLALSRFSEKAWRRACAEAGPAAPGTFVPDEMFARVAESRASAVGVPRNELLEAAGYQWVLTHLALPSHRQLLQLIGPTFAEALTNQNQLHHNAKASEYHEMPLPEFAVVSSRPGATRLRFVPSRVARFEWTQPFLCGAVRALSSELHKMRAAVEVVHADPKTMEVVLDITWHAEPPADAGSGQPSSQSTAGTAASTEDDDDSDGESAEDSGTVSPTYTCGLNGPALATVHPFHVVLESSGKLLQAGPSLRKLLPELEVGHRVNSVLAVQYPVSAHGRLSVRALRKCTHEVAMLTANARRAQSDIPVAVTLKGQFVSSGRRLVFIGAPMFTSIHDLTSFGLSLNDFAVADATLTLLFQQRSGLHSMEELASTAATTTTSSSAAAAAAPGGSGEDPHATGSSSARVRGGTSLLDRLFGSSNSGSNSLSTNAGASNGSSSQQPPLHQQHQQHQQQQQQYGSATSSPNLVSGGMNGSTNPPSATMVAGERRSSVRRGAAEMVAAAAAA